MISEVAACVNHPLREAIGICVQCRTRICAECVTKVDGINFCVTCLAARAAPEARSEPARAGASRSRAQRAIALSYLFALWLLTWLLLDTLLPGGV